MPAERITLRKLREIAIDIGWRRADAEIARLTGPVPSAVRETIKRIATTNLRGPLPEGLSDADLKACFAAGWNPTGLSFITNLADRVNVFK